MLEEFIPAWLERAEKMAKICVFFYTTHGLPVSVMRKFLKTEYGEGLAKFIFGEEW